MTPQSSTIFCGVPSVFMILAIKALVALYGVSSHFIWPFEEWLVLNFLQDLVYQLSKHRVNHLSNGKPRMPSKVSSGPVTIVFVQPEIHPLLKDNLSIPFPLLLIDPLILINSVHELTYIVYGFPSQRFPQAMLGR